MIDQTDFLGHKNLFGHTTSMQEVQRAQVSLWTSVFTASIKVGSSAQYATNDADIAVAKFNERFVPPVIKPDNLDC